MEHLKLFENYGVIQQPVCLHRERLYLSDDFAKFLVKNYYTYDIGDYDDFFNNTMSDEKYVGHLVKYINIDVHTNYNNYYVMSHMIKRWNETNNVVGYFQYYLSGTAGSYTMYGTRMKKASKECIVNFISLFFPIFKEVENSYKTLLLGKPLFEILKDTLLENKSLVELCDFKYSPPELDNYPEMMAIIDANKFNL